MRKDEQLIEEKLSGFKDLYPDEYSEVLSAMEQQAIAFGKYLENAPKRKVKAVNAGRIHYHIFTIEEHYQIFNNPTNGE